MVRPGSLRIVIAEDSCPDVVLVKAALRAAGLAAELTVFPDGEQCARYLKAGHEPPDAIILDLHLPLIEGLELLRAVRRDPRFDRVPVAMLTSSAQPEDRRTSLNLGASAFITKPCSLEGYLSAVGSAIHAMLAPGPAGGPCSA
ncbi:MAG TPA: response regulator [Bryobacteraceae bacterium]|jgi:CheY-like chemotaxis protein|nr:response regulator [Bryobacteraceae bacterium]